MFFNYTLLQLKYIPIHGHKYDYPHVFDRLDT